MDKKSPIFVAGHNGMVGSAIVRELKAHGYNNLVLKSSKELDLRNQVHVDAFFKSTQIDYVFLAAAKVGGIQANNQYPAEFIYENMMIQNNVIHYAFKNNIKKLLFLGSSCIYPKYSNQPIKEEYLLSGYLEPTNEAYALAKISGLKMCEFYHKQYGFNAIAVMPTNLYGPHDNFDLETSHVLPALIRKIHEAKMNNDEFVEVWGTGSPLREFMYVEDFAEALVFLMESYNENQFINVGTGEDISILALAKLISDIVGYNGTIKFDATKPDGTPRKLLDVSRLNSLGFKAKTSLEDGIRKTYQWYLEEGLKS
jgi:GDP-L-fucose synthase